MRYDFYNADIFSMKFDLYTEFYMNFATFVSEFIVLQYAITTINRSHSLGKRENDAYPWIAESI